jgi:hypothetical protein
MPGFRFDDWPHSPIEVYSLTVLAVMIYPYDEILYHELRDTFLTEFALRQEGTLGRPTPDTLWRLVRTRHAGRAAQEVLHAAEKVMEREGFLSGELVLLIYRLVHEPSASAIRGGVLKACDMLAQAAKFKHQTTVKTPIPRKTSKWFQGTVWKPYRSVAHLWTAFMILSKQDARVWTSQGWYIPWSHMAGDRQSFVTFLSLAEHYRQFLTSYRPHAMRGQPLLTSEETWTFPLEIALTPFDIHDISPLPAAYQQARKSYTARRRSRRLR